ncbi:retrotransposon protein, putative, ty1-copia subclass [Tanacetum coccineum]
MKLKINSGRPLSNTIRSVVAIHISQEFKDYLKANRIVQQLTSSIHTKNNGSVGRRNRTMLDMVLIYDESYNYCLLSFWDYALESATRNSNWFQTKKGCEALVKKDTPDKLEQRSVKYAEFLRKGLISQEISGRAVDLEEIQEEEDTTPSENASNIPQEVEGFKPPQEEVIPIRRSERRSRAPNRLCLNSLISGCCFMNAEIQSLMDNMLWVPGRSSSLVVRVGIRLAFKIKDDMDVLSRLTAVLVAKGDVNSTGLIMKKRSHPSLTLELLGFSYL